MKQRQIQRRESSIFKKAAPGFDFSQYTHSTNMSGTGTQKWKYNTPESERNQAINNKRKAIRKISASLQIIKIE